jgi:hypothetical protein
MIRHKGCGGEVCADWSLQYEYEGYTVPAHRCRKCKREILGDAEVDLGNDEPTAQYKVSFNKGRGEWLAVVYRDEPGGVRRVLTVGCEDTEADAVRWARGTIGLMAEHRRDDVELPDKYERRVPQ